MTARTPLERECVTFTRYLIASESDSYVIRKYAEAHEVDPTYTSGDRFGRAATRVARTHPLLAKLADSHARHFAPRGLLRKKLIVLLAILETSAPFYRRIDELDLVSRPFLVLRLTARGLGSVLSLLVGTLLLLPLQLILLLVESRDRS